MCVSLHPSPSPPLPGVLPPGPRGAPPSPGRTAPAPAWAALPLRRSPDPGGGCRHGHRRGVHGDGAQLPAGVKCGHISVNHIHTDKLIHGQPLQHSCILFRWACSGNRPSAVPFRPHPPPHSPLQGNDGRGQLAVLPSTHASVAVTFRVSPAGLQARSPIVGSLMACRPRVNSGVHRVPMARLVREAGRSPSQVRGRQEWGEGEEGRFGEIVHGRAFWGR